MRLSLFAIGLISASAIAYQLLLMRLFSIVQWHHFAFMIISIALLGYGASGTFLTFARRKLAPVFNAAWRVNAVLFGVAAYLGFALAQRLAFNPLEIAWNPGELLLLSATYALLLLPFFFAANCIGLAFACFGGRAAPIYAADLTGAGLGAVCAVLLMIALPAHFGLTMMLGLGFIAAGLLKADWKTPIWIAAGAAASVLAPASWIAPQPSQYKGLSTAILAPKAEILAERHTPLGVIAVVESPVVPFRHAPGLSAASPHLPPDQLGVFIDGEGPQAIDRFDGDFGDVAYLDYTTDAAPYHAGRRARVLVLGAGTGGAVLLARYHDARRVDAVEPNPFLVELLRAEFADYGGAVYNQPSVTLQIAEARAFVAGSPDRYDLIHVPLSASPAGSVLSGLDESYVYTVEALGLYIDRLTSGGAIAITREAKNPPRDSLKLIAASIEALSARGVADPGRHLVLVRSLQTFTLLIKNEPFERAEIDRLKRFMAERFFDAGYYPGMRRDEANQYNILDAPYLFDGATALLSDNRRRFIADYKFDITPASDNRPYFDNFFKWSSLSEQLSLHGTGGYPLLERGYVILIATLVQAIVLALILILSPLRWLSRQESTPPAERWRTVFYFTALGLSFLFIEIIFIQRFTLFLGHPLYSVSVILASFLVFAGAGAAVSHRICGFLERRSVVSPVTAIALAIAALAILAIALLPHLFTALSFLTVPLKAAATAVLIAPLAFFMGMPFPIGLHRLAEGQPALIPWAWGINGCASVLSPILAMVLSIHWGFNAVIVLAVGLYFVAAAAAPAGRALLPLKSRTASE